LQYIEAWLGGTGAVAIHNLMEDAATAEISRAQVWQWIRHGAALADGRPVTAALARALLSEELARLERRLGPEAFAAGRFPLAAELFLDLIEAEELADFLTLAAYPHL